MDKSINLIVKLSSVCPFLKWDIENENLKAEETKNLEKAMFFGSGEAKINHFAFESLLCEALEEEKRRNRPWTIQKDKKIKKKKRQKSKKHLQKRRT